MRGGLVTERSMTEDTFLVSAGEEELFQGGNHSRGDQIGCLGIVVAKDFDEEISLCLAVGFPFLEE